MTLSINLGAGRTLRARMVESDERRHVLIWTCFDGAEFPASPIALRIPAHAIAQVADMLREIDREAA